ncbi:MAG: alpha/beta hydrolase [Phycisphaerae bacterium]|nr:alpha/beta hydrolase [Phycisphaerae bacterium]
MPGKARNALLLAALVLCGLTPAASAQRKDKQPAASKVLRDIEYAKVGGLSLKLDLYLPPKPKGTRLLVWIHGGGWRQGSKNRCPLARFTEHAYSVASVQYRLSDKAVFPAQIHDCKGAIRWLRANAGKYGYDAERIGVAGISAGGHLVALLGTGGDVKQLEGKVGGNPDQSSRVQAVLDMCGPSDFLLMLEKAPLALNNPRGAVGQLVGGPVGKKKDLARLASPAHHVTQDDAPLLIFHGENDRLVNPRQSRHLADLYKKTGLPVALEVIPGGGHVPRQFFDAKRMKIAGAFFARHLKIETAE